MLHYSLNTFNVSATTQYTQVTINAEESHGFTPQKRVQLVSEAFFSQYRYVNSSNKEEENYMKNFPVLHLILAYPFVVHLVKITNARGQRINLLSI